MPEREGGSVSLCGTRGRGGRCRGQRGGRAAAGPAAEQEEGAASGERGTQASCRECQAGDIRLTRMAMLAAMSTSSGRRGSPPGPCRGRLRRGGGRAWHRGGEGRGGGRGGAGARRGAALGPAHGWAPAGHSRPRSVHMCSCWWRGRICTVPASRWAPHQPSQASTRGSASTPAPTTALQGGRGARQAGEACQRGACTGAQAAPHGPITAAAHAARNAGGRGAGAGPAGTSPSPTRRCAGWR